MKCKWLIDQYMIDHNEQDIVSVLKEQGFDVVVRPYNRFERTPPLAPFEANDCVVSYGSLQFVAQHKSLPILPGAYLQPQALQCSVYTNNIPTNWLLNENTIMATFGDLQRRSAFFKTIFGQEVFVRPNSSLKTFSGFVLNGNWEQELNALNQTSSVSSDTMVVIAAPQQVLAEYRMFIVNREVVTGSQYEKDGKPHLSSKCPADVWALAQLMADNDWQPDIAYVCDIATTKNGPKIIEFNGLSTSGWYLADMPKLIDAVSNAAVAEWNGELSLGDPKPSKRAP